MIHDDAALMLAAGSVLGDLAPDERAAYQGHRDSCVECRQVERELDQVMTDLSLAAPERVPPPGLLDDVRRALAAERQRPVTR